MDLMIDIETLSVDPVAAVLSIGAVAFSAKLGIVDDTFYVVLDVNAQPGRRIEYDVMAWWMEQAKANPEATDVFVQHRRLHPRIALQQLNDYRKKWTSSGHVWAKGPHFDLVILQSLYQDVGLVPEWTFRGYRDVRTLEQVIHDAGLSVEVTPNSLQHNALADAKHQALYVIEAYKQLRLG